MKRVDQWETVVAIASHASKPRTTRGAKYALSSFRIAANLDKLARLARTLRRYYEWQCNEDTAPHMCTACEGHRGEKHSYTTCAGAKIETLQARAIAIGVELGCTVENQTDPRGAAIKVWDGVPDARGSRLLGVFS